MSCISGEKGSDDFESPEPLSADHRVDHQRVLPSLTDPIVAPASAVIGGPIGHHAVVGRARFFTPIRVLFALALLGLALSWFGKAGCLQQVPVESSAGSSTTFKLDWDHQRQYFGLCYSDAIALYGNEHLDTGALPYKTYWVEKHQDGSTIKRYMEYPVLTGMYMYGVAKLTHWWQIGHDRWGLPSALDAVMFFNFAALGLALFWLVTIWATGRTAGVRVWAPWLAALSPLIFVHAFTNFDAIPIAFVALAMWAWAKFDAQPSARWGPWVAGAFIGLGVASKLYPILLLVAIGIVCLRTRRVTALVATASAALGVWLAINAPVLLQFPHGWAEFFRYNVNRDAESDSLFGVARDIGGFTWNTGVLNATSLALLLLAIVGIVVLGMIAPKPPSLAQLMFLLVAAFLITNKIWSPQYSLWLVPLAVLAVRRPRLVLAWMVIDALVWIPRMSLFLDTNRMWLTPQWFNLAVLIRTGMVIALCVVVVCDVLGVSLMPKKQQWSAKVGAAQAG